MREACSRSFVAVAALVVSTAICLHATNGTIGTRAFLTQSSTATLRPQLVVAAGSSAGQKRLTVVEGGIERGSVEVPARVTAEALSEGLEVALIHPNGQDVAVGFRGRAAAFARLQKTPESFVVVFLRQGNGSYLAVDVSRVELANIGFVGPDRSYSDVVTVPVEWLVRPDGDGMVQIRLQTRVRDQSGQRYRPTEPLLITRDGRPLWR